MNGTQKQTAVHRQTTVTAHFMSKQLLLFAFARPWWQYTCVNKSMFCLVTNVLYTFPTKKIFSDRCSFNFLAARPDYIRVFFIFY